MTETLSTPKVVILCGGLGTRLREETEYRPKPMVKIGDRPILWHIMKIYSHYGFNDFILCLGYKGEIIKEYFYNYEILNSDFTIELGMHENIKIHNSSNDNWKITLVDTGDRALKGSRLKKIEKYIDSDIFMVTYGDGLANIDIKDLIKFHKLHGKIATLTGVFPPSRFGSITVDGHRVVKFSEKPQSSEGLVNGGFFVFNKDIFDHLSLDNSCELETDVLVGLTEKGELAVYKFAGNWVCMDTMRDVEYLNNLWLSDDAFWKIY